MESAKPFVHVVFGMSAAGSLRQALAKLALDQTVLGLPDDLSFGPINPPAHDVRDQWIEEVLGYDDYEEYGQRAEIFWKQATDTAVTPVAWVCRRCASEYSGFLEFLWRIGDQHFLVIDMTDFQFPANPNRPGSGSWITSTFGFVSENYIVNSGIIDTQTTLEKRQIDAYRALWAHLRTENAPFRVVSDAGLRSAPITHFDEAIKSCLTQDWQKCARVIHETMGILLDGNFHQSGNLILESRLRMLGAQHAVEIRGDASDSRTSEARLPPPTITA
ncbi:DUF3658 domain-containing protein [Bosea sp. OK403]|uniref:DUF3658 domain-containing protein n=1 Tax=Bosea sp. OK403 TaxID=1855286 RepID=UPI0015879338|nr:DUF3658 domain-containing protein [Bosea sp. OK403]